MVIWSAESVLLEGVSAADYHADAFGEVPTLSRSVAHTGITASWKHAAAEHPRLPGIKAKRATKEMDLGSLVHALLLGGEESIVVVEADNFTTKVARGKRNEAWEAGLTPICRPQFEQVKSVAGRVGWEILDVLADLAGVPFLAWEEVGREQTVLWEEGYSLDRGVVIEKGMIRCRARLDLAVKRYGILGDIKVITSGQAGDVDSEAFIRKVNDWRQPLGIQAGCYSRGFEAAVPELAGRTRFVFLRVEVTPPYCVVPVLVPEGMRSLGEARWLRGVAGWAKCMASGVWSPPGPAVAHVESWAMEREQLAQIGGDGP